MKRFRTLALNNKRTLCGSAMFIILCFASSAVTSQDAITGADEFQISCASCHGISGKGDGKMSPILTVEPSDLTSLTNRNHGHFSANKIYMMIDGREEFYAHGDRDMPVWGIRYLQEHAVRYGNLDGEYFVQQCISKLVDYIHSIQE